MIDIHCHILPGVDDGARDLEEAVTMCRLAAADGCEAMIATPHQRHPYWWNHDLQELEDLRAELQERLGDEIRLYSGGEIRADDGFLKAVGELPGGSIHSLAGSHYLLVEFDRAGLGPDPENLLHELQVAGWRPIVAHPEMYPWLMRDPGLLDLLAEMGTLFQITAMSVCGRFGRFAQRSSRDLLDAGRVHFVASDSHGLDYRRPGLSEAFQVLAKGWGEERARALCRENALAILEDRPLP